MTKKYEVGANIRLIKDSEYGSLGEVFTIKSVYDDGSGVLAMNDRGDFASLSFDEFELVAEQTPVPSLSPELADLLANMSRRLYEVEQAIKPSAEAESTTQADRIEAVCNEVRDLLIRKNHDYGDSFSKQFAKYGVNSAMIRMDDKMRRLETLLGGEQAQVSESIEDSIADLVGYGILTLVELRKGA